MADRFHSVVFLNRYGEIYVSWYARAHTRSELIAYVRRWTPFLLDDPDWDLLGFSQDRFGSDPVC